MGLRDWMIGRGILAYVVRRRQRWEAVVKGLGLRLRRPKPIVDPLLRRSEASPHCQTAFRHHPDGVETPYWEMNVRLKLDTRETGPEPGKPAILGAGMAGDRVSIVFSSLEELTRFVAESCP